MFSFNFYECIETCNVTIMLGQQIIYLFLVLIVYDCVLATLIIGGISSRNSVKTRMKTSSGRQGLPERVEGESQGIVPEYNKSDHQPKPSDKSDIKYTQSDENEATWQTHSNKNKYLREVPASETDLETFWEEFNKKWRCNLTENKDPDDYPEFNTDLEKLWEKLKEKWKPISKESTGLSNDDTPEEDWEKHWEEDDDTPEVDWEETAWKEADDEPEEDWENHWEEDDGSPEEDRETDWEDDDDSPEVDLDTDWEEDVDVPKADWEEHWEKFNEKWKCQQLESIDPDDEEFDWKREEYQQYLQGDDTNRETRSLAIGDTFTTSEMLEVAKRLRQKVTISNGKGIISSAKNPYRLAEKLFGAVFKTSKTIVVIQEDELATLDALQALSLHGNVVSKLRSSTESFTQSPVINIDGKLEPVDFTYRCHYKVLRKPIDENATYKTDKPVPDSFHNPRRRKITNILKKLAKHQNLMVNTAQRSGGQNIKKSERKRKITKILKKMARNQKLMSNTTQRGVKQNIKKIKHLHKQSSKTGGIKKQKRIPKARRYRVARQRNQRRKNVHTSSKKLQPKKSHKRQGTGKSNVICRWVYACSLGTLESCRLHPRCMSKKEDAEARTNGEPIDIQQFRKMAGIDAIDEEVEKILEMQIIASKIKYEKSPFIGRIESLGQYFHRILSLRATTPSSLRAESMKEISYKKGSQKTAVLISDSIRSRKVTKDDSDSEARKILGVTGPPVNVQY